MIITELFLSASKNIFKYFRANVQFHEIQISSETFWDNCHKFLIFAINKAKILFFHVAIWREVRFSAVKRTFFHSKLLLLKTKVIGKDTRAKIRSRFSFSKGKNLLVRVFSFSFRRNFLASAIQQIAADCRRIVRSISDRKEHAETTLRLLEINESASRKFESTISLSNVLFRLLFSHRILL